MSALSLRAGDAKLEIATLGAEARVWRVAGNDLLWPGDAAIWDQISPILYPVVGWTRDGARAGGRQYALGLHGFAAKHQFEVEAAREDFVRLTLRDNAATREIYPFGFALALEYRLTAHAFDMAIEVENPGDAPAPYACGTHPGFRWPFAGARREGAVICFAGEERPYVPVMAPGGLIDATLRPVPLANRRLPLSDALFSGDALCFLDCASRSLRFEQADGSAIQMDFPGFAHCALWMRPGAPFLCLEAWTGYSDPAGFTGDLFAKPSMRVLQPGERARHEASYRFFPAVAASPEIP